MQKATMYLLEELCERKIDMKTIIATHTPALWASMIASTHSGRGGSMMSQRPTIVNQGPPHSRTKPASNCAPSFTSSSETQYQHTKTIRAQNRNLLNLIL
mmetsp:Transcript_12884/g.18548  ORF Transcript_12884/g.18548 Transcript_12884/m.18548 type:complete len:100 (-) Transcript_12884:527-826(-)